MENNFLKNLGLLDSGIPVRGAFLDSLSSPLLILAISLALVTVLGLIYFIVNREGSSSSDTGKTHRLTKSNAIEGGGQGKKSKRHKRRRRDHRKRNLTLSEAGGLPPVSKTVNTEKSTNK